MARIVEVIYTERRAGNGSDGDPIRICPQLWTKDGNLIAEYDPITGKGLVLPGALVLLADEE